MSPRWPYLVNTAISLDHGRPTLVDLVDHSRPRTHGGPQTVQSHVVWKATGLKNTRHSLLISVGAGQPYAIVDGLMYVLSLFLCLLVTGIFVMIVILAMQRMLAPRYHPPCHQLLLHEPHQFPQHQQVLEVLLHHQSLLPCQKLVP